MNLYRVYGVLNMDSDEVVEPHSTVAELYGDEEDTIAVIDGITEITVSVTSAEPQAMFISIEGTPEDAVRKRYYSVANALRETSETANKWW